MADEEPAPAPTPSLEDGLYTILKDAVGEACEGVDNNTASLAVHKAMAKAMADVVTDHKITEEGAIDLDQKFIEQWALTQLLMKDKHGDRRLAIGDGSVMCWSWGRPS